MKVQTLVVLLLICLAVGLAVYQLLPKESITFLEIPATHLKGIVIPLK